MMKRWILVALLVLMTNGRPAEAQRPGGRPSGSTQGQRQGEMPGQSAQGPGQQQGTRGQQEMRVRGQATDQQRTTMKQALSASKELRSQLRTMIRVEKEQQVGADQAKRWREQIRAQFALMQEQQHALLASLSLDQQSWVADDLQQMNQATASIEVLMEELIFELEQVEVDEQTVKQKAKKVDDKAKKVESEEEQIMAELDLS